MSERSKRWAAVTAFGVCVGVGAGLSDRGTLALALGVLLGAAAAVPLYRWDGAVLLGPAVAGTAGLAVLCSPRSANVGWFGLCVLGSVLAIRAGQRVTAAYLAGVVGLVVVEWTALDSDPGWAAWVAGTVFAVTASTLLARNQRLLAELRVAQAGLADRARVEERGRIARELHDVIAHSLTVSLLHVSSARLAVRDDPAAAAPARAAPPRLGRESLTEVRQAVGLLRDPAGGDRTAPMPGADGLPALVEGFRRAGVTVDYLPTGDPAALPATTGLTLYRIAQEALTNAAKHAPGASVTVTVAVGADRTVLTVDSAGPAGVPSPDGVGLTGMRERAESLGGTLGAGPEPGGRSWRVRAELPAARQRVAG